MLLPEAIPTADSLLALEPEELAGYVLEHLQGGNPAQFKEHQANFASDYLVRNYPQQKQDECRRALMEAWSCLVHDGLLVPEPNNPHPVYVLSRRGRKIGQERTTTHFATPPSSLKM